MVFTNLDDYLLPALNAAQEVWIATALVSDEGYERLRPALARIRQHFLVGVDLPTSPSVLRTIQGQLSSGLVEARLASYYPLAFHPKVYIIKMADHLEAVVGSANLTGPGLNGNQEVSFVTNDQDQCRSLVLWFRNLFDQGFLLTEANLEEYERCFVPGDGQSGGGRPSTRRPTFSRPSADEAYFDTIDLSGYFFGKSDYLAFRRAIQEDRSRAANREREAVWDKFHTLHNIIFPQFQAYGIGALHHHSREANIVSHSYHADGYTQQKLTAMWLSYGKSRVEIEQYQERYSNHQYDLEDDRDRFSFIHHPRLQVRIEVRSLGIWLLFAKNDGSLHDREDFVRKMRDEGYRQSFFEELKRLRDPYWIRVNNTRRFVREFREADELHRFCRRDRTEEYFEIGRDYDITDPALLRSQFPITVLEEFRRIFPLYQMMRHFFIVA